MVRSPFTGHVTAGLVAVTNDYMGTLPYTTMPVVDHPYASNLRAAAPPPIVAPGRGPNSLRKAGVPREVSPAWWGSIGGATIGPTGTAPARTKVG